MTRTLTPPAEAGTGAGTPAMSPWAAVKLVAGRELSVKLRDKTFLFSTLFFLVFTAGSLIVPAMIEGSPTKVAVVTGPAADQLRAAGLDVRTVADGAAAERLVRDGDVDAAVVAGDGPTGLVVLAMDDRPGDVVNALSTSPTVRLLDPDALDPVLVVLAPLAFSLVFFFTVFTFGYQIAQSVTEEKQTRIVEILVATVQPRALLAGKIIASTTLAMGQIALIAVVAVVGMQLTDSAGLLDVLGPAIGWFLPFFVLGFVMLASLWAVAGALASRIEDLASTIMPIQMLVMLPFFAVSFLSSNETVMTVLSYVPFSAPTAMPIRMFFGNAEPWEPLVALAVLLGSAVAFLVLGACLYEGSLLRTNGKTSLRTAWRLRA